MKTVYFVRHGSTEANEEKTAYQHWETSLSKTGKKQALVVAERFTRIPIDAIIASDMKRAVETAEAIGGAIGRETQIESLFHEIIRPTAIRGKLLSDQEAIEIRRFTDENWANPDKRHSDEENFFDLKKRGLFALEYLENRDEETILVVTHGTFLRMLISLMAMGENLSSDEFLNFERFLHPSNTGITKCVYEKEWRLWVWNDHANLG